MRFKLPPTPPDLLTNLTDKRTIYLLGLLWADGYFTFSGIGGSIGIACVNDDAEPIKRICAAHGMVHWQTKQAKRNGLPWGRLQFVMRLRMDTARDKLLEWGFDTKSSPHLLLSQIPSHLRHYWWRGYLDGDGCVYVGKRKVELTFWSTFDQDWSFVEALFRSLGLDGLKTVRFYRKGGKHRSSSISCYRQSHMRAFLYYVYDGDDISELGFARKHAKYMDLLARDKQVSARRAPPTSRYPHVSKRGRNHRWRAFIWRFNAKLGLFDTEEEAHQAVQQYLAAHPSIERPSHREYAFDK